MIEEQVEAHPETVIWDFLGMLSKKNLVLAMDLWLKLLQMGEFEINSERTNGSNQEFRDSCR
jgi:hypothetical protein